MQCYLWGQEPGLKGTSLAVHTNVHVFAMGCSVIACMHAYMWECPEPPGVQILCSNELVQSLILKILRGKCGTSDK